MRLRTCLAQSLCKRRQRQLQQRRRRKRRNCHGWRSSSRPETLPALLHSQRFAVLPNNVFGGNPWQPIIYVDIVPYIQRTIYTVLSALAITCTYGVSLAPQIVYSEGVYYLCQHIHCTLATAAVEMISGRLVVCSSSEALERRVWRQTCGWATAASTQGTMLEPKR